MQLKPILRALPFRVAMMLTGATLASPAVSQCQDEGDMTPDTGGYRCTGFYAGIGTGISRLEPRVVNLPESLDKTLSAPVLHGLVGYDFSPHFSLEAHASDQGEATFDSGAAIKYRHWGASIVYHLKEPVPGWQAHALLGLGQLKTSLAKGRDDNGFFAYEQLNATQVHAGIGLGYLTRSLWGLRLDGLVADKDSQQLTLSLTKHFNRVLAPVVAAPVAVAPPPPAPEPVKPAAPEICNAPKGLLEGVYFVSASAELTAPSRQILAKIAADLLPFPDIQLAIRAHTDSQGSDAYNQTLSQARAKSVQMFLQGLGIDHIQSEGFGESKPVADNNTESGRAPNRRVEIEVLSDECKAVETL